MRARGYKDMRRRAPQHVGERERELALALLFICLSFPGPVLCKLGQPAVLLFYLRSSLRSSDLLLFHFAGFFLPCLLATAILDPFSLFYLPNIPPSRDGRPNSLGIGASRYFWLLPVELGQRGILGLPLLLVSSLRVLIVVSI